jgi:hypothetical protein
VDDGRADTLAQAMPSAMIASTVSGMPGCSAWLQGPFNATSIHTFRMAPPPLLGSNEYRRIVSRPLVETSAGKHCNLVRAHVMAGHLGSRSHAMHNSLRLTALVRDGGSLSACRPVETRR